MIAIRSPIQQIEDEARKELIEEQAKAAKTKIKASLQAIARAEAVVANLKQEHAVILRLAGESLV